MHTSSTWYVPSTLYIIRACFFPLPIMAWARRIFCTTTGRQIHRVAHGEDNASRVASKKKRALKLGSFRNLGRSTIIDIYTRWFKVTFSSPSWRSLNHLKGSLNHPKEGTKNCIPFHSWCINLYTLPKVDFEELILKLKQTQHSWNRRWAVAAIHNLFSSTKKAICTMMMASGR